MLFTILVSALLVAVDQILKLLAARYLAPVGSAPLIPGIIGLKYVENRGAAFNILDGMQGLLIVVTGAALLFGAWLLLFRRPKDKLEYTAILLLFAGGVGNLIDRIARGYVVDYLNLLFMRFAVFNFADCLVCIGFALLVVAVFRAEGRAQKQKKLAAAQAGAGEAAPTVGALPGSVSDDASEAAPKNDAPAGQADAED
ncbi:signal peptidase II [Ruminococcaceae bacterium OttesenSCG-928-O06]|nr:signal peptidase II [Ruminococcaceae bacterium OttesenSCG-928-O06]